MGGARRAIIGAINSEIMNGRFPLGRGARIGKGRDGIGKPVATAINDN